MYTRTKAVTFTSIRQKHNFLLNFLYPHIVRSFETDFICKTSEDTYKCGTFHGAEFTLQI